MVSGIPGDTSRKCLSESGITTGSPALQSKERSARCSVPTINKSAGCGFGSLAGYHENCIRLRRSGSVGVQLVIRAVKTYNGKTVKNPGFECRSRGGGIGSVMPVTRAISPGAYRIVVVKRISDPGRPNKQTRYY